MLIQSHGRQGKTTIHKRGGGEGYYTLGKDGGMLTTLGLGLKPWIKETNHQQKKKRSRYSKLAHHITEQNIHAHPPSVHEGHTQTNTHTRPRHPMTTLPPLQRAWACLRG